MNSSSGNTYISSILVPDRVGLLKDVTKAIFSLEGNIGAIRQTLVDGFFSLVFTSIHPDEITTDALKSILTGTLEESALITVTHKEDNEPPAPPLRGPRYIVMTRGSDKPGTICAISSFMVEYNINIEDWIVEEEDGEIIYIAQVVIPENVDFQAIQNKFREEMAAMNLTGMLCHTNIFRATNEIGPIKPLIG